MDFLMDAPSKTGENIEFHREKKVADRLENEIFGNSRDAYFFFYYLNSTFLKITKKKAE